MGRPDSHGGLRRASWPVKAFLSSLLAQTPRSGADNQAVRLPAIVACVIAAAWLSIGLRAQRNGATELLLRVEPDAHLSPLRVTLRLHLDPAPNPHQARQTELITARVRALPGQRIRLLARASPLAGPAGGVPASRLQWSGKTIAAASQAGQAVCGSGGFLEGEPSDLIHGWTRSGAVTCEITFSLTGTGHLPAGLYTGVVDLAVRTE